MHGVTIQTWAELAAPLAALVAWIGRVVAKKVDQVTIHLRAQDTRHLLMTERLARIEGRLQLTALPAPEIDANGNNVEHPDPDR